MRAVEEKTFQHARRRRAVLSLLAGRLGSGRAAPSCCSIAATSIPAAWRILPTSSICRTSPSSPGMRAATAARPASAASARASAPRCATCRRSSTISPPPTASRSTDMAVIAQSVGAVLVATWAHDYAPQIRCMVLASPAFKVKLYVPFARAGPAAAAARGAAISSSTPTSSRNS